MSDLRSWVTRTVAMLVAWNLVLALAAIAGTLLGVRLWPVVIVWLWFGLLLMLRRPGPHPMPDDKSVDVPGALAMLWWAARWPLRMFGK